MSSALIRGGLVVDGTGRAAFPADVLVEGDRIADVIDDKGKSLHDDLMAIAEKAPG